MSRASRAGATDEVTTLIDGVMASEPQLFLRYANPEVDTPRGVDV